MLAPAIAVCASLTVTNVLCNILDAESAKMLAEVAKQKGISLCGIQRDQTTADLFGKGLKPADAILLASDLSQAVVSASLTQLTIGNNPLGYDGFRVLLEGCKASASLAILNLDSDEGLIEGRGYHLGPEGAKHVAELLSANASVTEVR